MPKAFYLVLTVQFVSTLADNAFLIVAIARVIELNRPEWLIPILKISLTLFYVVLAPFVGPFADFFRKGRVMLLANACKVLAISLLLCGLDPLLAIGLSGLGAAIYAPAKYGLITELLPANDLVRANGFFEGATVSAVIFGTVVGGMLISPLVSNASFTSLLKGIELPHSAYVTGMVALLALNLLSTALSLFVADSGARYSGHSFRVAELFQRFHRENLTLWRDSQGGLSMTVTTLLWGVGATLQLVVLRWAHEFLGLTLAQAAYLQGMTAIGVIAGALLASHYIALAVAVRLLPIGIAMGLLIPVLLLIHSVFLAAALLVVVGGLAGFFVVPMNALLQHRGYTLLTAGRSVAVQGFNENAGILLMLGFYATAIAMDISLTTLIIGFGGLVTCGMALILLSSSAATSLYGRRARAAVGNK